MAQVGNLLVTGPSRFIGPMYVTKVGSEIHSDGSIYAPAFYESSDIRKKNIIGEVSLEKSYELIDKCQSIIYTLKDNTDKEQLGLIAQEVEEFFPEVIETDNSGFKTINYSRLVVVCFKVLKDIINRLELIENGNRN